MTVSGSGFPPGSLVVIVQCLAGAGQAGCDLSRQTLATADGFGELASTFRVSRLPHVDGTTDCATPGACLIGAGVPLDGSAGSATAPIAFAADAAPRTTSGSTPPATAGPSGRVAPRFAG